jgi:hypothetical protein
VTSFIDSYVHAGRILSVSERTRVVVESRQVPAATHPTVDSHPPEASPRTSEEAVGQVLAGIFLIVVIEFGFVVFMTWFSDMVVSLVLCGIDFLVMVCTLVTGIVLIGSADRKGLGVGLLVGSLLGGLFALILRVAIVSAFLSQI